MDTLASSIKILGENFIGFSKEVGSTLEAFDHKLELLRNFSLIQLNEMRTSIIGIAELVDNKAMISSIMSMFNDYRLSENNLLQNELIILLDGIQTYENIFATLNSGRLSHGLIGWNKLKRILYNIDKSFDRDFQFAIRQSEKHLYYTLPLVPMAIDPKTYNIYVSLRIPLIRKGRPRLYSIVKPLFLPFSCYTDECFNYSG